MNMANSDIYHLLPRGFWLSTNVGSNRDNTRVQIMHRLYYFLLVAFILSSALLKPVVACPQGCFCASDIKNVICTKKGFTHIPIEDIPENTVELVMNENKFANTLLSRRNFTGTGLTKVQDLYLKECGIETIAVDTFVDLTQLRRLDISRNKIRFIADYTFRGLNLKHLHINDNMGLQLAISAFAGLTSQGLYMHNCGLRRLPVDLMTPLNGSLKILWLYGNNFESFNKKWLYFFQQLGHIRLGGNSFHCNCELDWLYSFYQSSKKTHFSAEDVPACGTPGNVKGRNFDELSSEDFRCELPTFQNVDAVFDSKMGKLSCTASGDPAPTLYWVRPDGTTEKFYPRSPSASDSSNGMLPVGKDKLPSQQISFLEQQERKQTQGVLFLTGVKMEEKENYKCVASNPAGNVTFSLNVVWPELKRVAMNNAKQPYSKGDSGTKDGGSGTDTIIRDVVESSSRDPGTHGDINNYAGDDSGAYGWGSSNRGMSSLGQSGGKKSHSVRRGIVSGSSNSDGRFNTVDIVGAIMGTFALTLLLCVTVFHFYYRRRERMRQREEHHYSVPDQMSCPMHPHQYPLPHHPLAPHPPPVSVYVMGDGDENAVKMLNHHHHHINSFECPS